MECLVAMLDEEPQDIMLDEASNDEDPMVVDQDCRPCAAPILPVCRKRKLSELLDVDEQREDLEGVSGKVESCLRSSF